MTPIPEQEKVELIRALTREMIHVSETMLQVSKAVGNDLLTGYLTICASTLVDLAGRLATLCERIRRPNV